jgi:protein disulfide-isomerase A1
MSNIGRFYRRVDVWMITYYKLDKKSERLKDIWKQLAEVMDGIIKVAAINCEESPELCDEQDIKIYPTILCFKADSSKPPSKFNIRISTRRLADFAINHLEDYV